MFDHFVKLAIKGLQTKYFLLTGLAFGLSILLIATMNGTKKEKYLGKFTFRQTQLENPN